jgi:isoleucyl-tRNA synthetase
VSYPQVEPQPNFPLLESQVLEYWKTDETFAASIEMRDAGKDGENEFVFYDGPPFANGLPHYGHLLTGFVKDAVPRYRKPSANLVFLDAKQSPILALTSSTNIAELLFCNTPVTGSDM